ncbi:ABC transporter permease [Jiella avicenniae]|uniref:ABC transporter permease n=1 Tax=Jiella avicenniae TaxID=2907202 RepID=A0A9X1T775_9HYPH|nr:ABC transporter permease [Jiella avicenniae]MCE7030594.1 ABC transporter permease [Jiella avicenniae]
MGASLANVFHLGTKELNSLWRDKVLLIFVVYAFSLAIYAAATAVSGTLNRAPIAIVDHDRSQLSARIENAFYPPFFTRPILIDESEMDRRLDEGRDTFALVVPPDFQKDVLAGRRPSVQLNVDATRVSQAFVGSGYVQSIVSGEVSAFARHYRAAEQLPVDLVLRARFNPSLDQSWFGAVVEIINNVTMLSIILTGAALIREREHGTIEHLLVMPLTPFEIMASKIWSMGLVVLLACGFSVVVVVQQLLSVSIQGSVALFLLGAALNLFATTSMGIFLATLARTMPQFGLLIILVLLPLQMLSGGLTPMESMPLAVQILMFAAPTSHFVTLGQAILFRGAGLAEVWPQFVAIAVIGAVLFGAALMRFRASVGAMA